MRRTSLPSVTTRNLQVAMGFVGNYAPSGLSPQIYDMPVILLQKESRDCDSLSVIRLGLEPRTPTLKVLCSTS